MKNTSTSLKLVLDLAKANTVLTRRFDRGLNGLGFSEFMILYCLNRAGNNALSRIDLAGHIGLTASGVTRLLLPMEKIGLVKKQTDPHDARLSLVQLAPGGKRKLAESVERAELLAEELIPSGKGRKFQELSEFLSEISSSAR